MVFQLDSIVQKPFKQIQIQMSYKYKKKRIYTQVITTRNCANLIQIEKLFNNL